MGTGYLNMLNKGGLKNSIKPLLSSHASKGYAVIDCSGAEQVLRLHVHDDELFLCDKHYEWGSNITSGGQTLRVGVKHYEVGVKHHEWG